MALNVTSTGLLNTSLIGNTITSLDDLFQGLTSLSMKNFFFPNIKCRPPLVQLETVSSCPVNPILILLRTLLGCLFTLLHYILGHAEGFNIAPVTNGFPRLFLEYHSVPW